MLLTVTCQPHEIKSPTYLLCTGEGEPEHLVDLVLRFGLEIITKILQGFTSKLGFWFIAVFNYFSCYNYLFADVAGVLAGIENLTIFADGRLVGHNNREFKQIATAGADTAAAEVNFPQNETLRMYVGCIQP